MAALLADGWNHNTHYHDRLLRAVPDSCRRALDVGCGLGTFARRLSGFADEVDAVDSNLDVIARARDLSTPVGNLRFIEADFMTWTADEAYDFIAMIAVLHHLPFPDAVVKARHLLRPGGVLAVLGLVRASSILEAAAQSSIAYPLSGCYRLVRRTSHVGAPMCEPTMRFSEIRQCVDALLPRAIVRRHVLWRYSLIWMKS